MEKRTQSNQLARECIVTALIQLTRQKPFSAITVSELTKRAGVSRMTYYRNYRSKEEVFESYMQELTAQYRQEVKQLPLPEHYGEYERILHCFRYFVQNKEFITCIIKIGMSKLLLDAISGYIFETYYTDDSSVEMYYLLCAYVGALLTVYVAWLDKGEKEPIETLANILSRQIQSSMAQEIRRKAKLMQEQKQNRQGKMAETENEKKTTSSL